MKREVHEWIEMIFVDNTNRIINNWVKIVFAFFYLVCNFNDRRSTK